MLEADAARLAEVLAPLLKATKPTTAGRGGPPASGVVLEVVLEDVRSFDREASRYFWTVFTDACTCGGLLALMERRGGPRRFLTEMFSVRDAKRAAVLRDALAFLDDAQKQFPGRTEAGRLRKWARHARPGDYFALSINGLRLLDFQRLRGRFGANAAIPSGRMTRYIANLLHRPVAQVEGLYLVERVGRIARADVRKLHEHLPTTSAS